MAGKAGEIAERVAEWVEDVPAQRDCLSALDKPDMPRMLREPERSASLRRRAEA